MHKSDATSCLKIRETENNEQYNDIMQHTKKRIYGIEFPLSVNIHIYCACMANIIKIGSFTKLLITSGTRK